MTPEMKVILTPERMDSMTSQTDAYRSTRGWMKKGYRLKKIEVYRKEGGGLVWGKF